MLNANVVAVCESDDKLSWWAMLLFAELSDMAHNCGYIDATVAKVMIRKIREFERLIVMEKVNESKATPSITKRVEIIEKKLGIKQ